MKRSPSSLFALLVLPIEIASARKTKRSGNSHRPGPVASGFHAPGLFAEARADGGEARQRLRPGDSPRDIQSNLKATLGDEMIGSGNAWEFPESGISRDAEMCHVVSNAVRHFEA